MVLFRVAQYMAEWATAIIGGLSFVFGQIAVSGPARYGTIFGLGSGVVALLTFGVAVYQTIGQTGTRRFVSIGVGIIMALAHFLVHSNQIIIIR